MREAIYLSAALLLCALGCGETPTRLDGGAVRVDSGGIDGAAAGPHFGECIVEPDGFDDCEAYCASVGESCAQDGCGADAQIFWGWRAGGEASCASLATPDSFGNSSWPCGDSLLWGGSSIVVRCCCAAP